MNYIDANGAHHTLQGVPEHKFEHNIDKLDAFFKEELFSDGANNRDSPFQRLRAKIDRGTDIDVPLNQPHTMVAEGDDLSSRWALMQDFADEVNSIGYEYRPYSQNSNSFAGAALQRGGFFGPGNKFPERFDDQLVFDPVSGETKSLYTPGFENPLTNPINDATPMPFPLGASAAPFVPSNGLLTPDHPDSFDTRFGSSRAAGDPGNTLSPLMRALQKYRDSALSNADDGNSSQASVFDTGTPPIRRLTSRNKSPSSDSQGSFGDRFGNWSSSAEGGSAPLNPPQHDTPPAQLVLPDQLNSPGGLAGWIAALASIDPQNPDQPAPSLFDDQRGGFKEDDPLQPWFARTPIRSLR